MKPERCTPQKQLAPGFLPAPPCYVRAFASGGCASAACRADLHETVSLVRFLHAPKDMNPASVPDLCRDIPKIACDMSSKDFDRSFMTASAAINVPKIVSDDPAWTSNLPAFPAASRQIRLPARRAPPAASASGSACRSRRTWWFLSHPRRADGVSFPARNGQPCVAAGGRQRREAGQGRRKPQNPARSAA